MINRVYFTNELSREDGITGQGYVELSESVNIDEVLDNSDPPSSAVFPSTAEFTTLCLLNVPPHMIPIEIIRFFNSHLSLIRSISIHRHAAASEKFFAVLHTNSFAATKTIFEEYNGQIISSVDKVHCIIYPVIQIVSTDQANESSTASSAALEPDNNEPSSCPVCLETISIENPMTITTCCNHRFHMECMMRLESDQCPVCSGSDLASECMECGTRASSTMFLSTSNSRTSGGTSSSNYPHTSYRTVTGQHHHHGHGFGGPKVDLWLCLICGYTGCGLRYGGHIQRHYENTLHTYAQNTDSRQVWDFAGDGYVHRLILSTSSSCTSAAAEDGDTSQYAPSSSSSSSYSAPKLVESGAAYSSTGARDTRPPLSSEQEDALVSGKLEAAARHYNQLLAWQLEQNRLLYEARLRRIRDSMPAADSARSTASNASGAKPTIISSSSGGGGRGGKGVSEGANWRENMIASLRTERVKVGKQLEGAKERLERARKEAAMLQELRSGLESNRQEWQRRADSAAGMLRDVQTTFQREIPALEEKVRVLMEKLDMAPKTATGARVPTGTSQADAPKEEDVSKG